MAEINYPSNPSNGQTHTDIINGIVWTFSSAGGWSQPNVATGTPDSFITGDNTRDNIVVGEDPVLLTGATGTENTVLGFETGKAITIGSKNTLVGVKAGTAIDSSIGNTVVGNDAGSALTLGANFNTILGHLAGKTHNNSGNVVVIGYGANPGGENQTNCIVIGSVAVGQGSNTVVLGNDQIIGTYLKGEVHLKSPAYVVGALPDPVVAGAGALIWVTDADPTDGLTGGTGCHCSSTGSAWHVIGTNIAVA